MSDKTKNQSNLVDDVIDKTFKRLKDIVDANTVIGSTITVGSTYILPISKISVGLISGGGTPNKKSDMSAGSGTGFNIIPVGFITVKDSLVNYLPVNNESTSNKVLDGMFKIYESIVNAGIVKEESNEKED